MKISTVGPVNSPGKRLAPYRPQKPAGPRPHDVEVTVPHAPLPSNRRVEGVPVACIARRFSRLTPESVPKGVLQGPDLTRIHTAWACSRAGPALFVGLAYLGQRRHARAHRLVTW